MMKNFKDFSFFKFSIDLDWLQFSFFLLLLILKTLFSFQKKKKTIFFKQKNYSSILFFKGLFFFQIQLFIFV